MFGQNTQPSSIFEIGKDEQTYRTICEAYPETLLTWKKDDYTQSALLWFDFLKSMETYADAIQFNLKGFIFFGMKKGKLIILVISFIQHQGK
jgi:hypothetical protein